FIVQKWNWIISKLKFFKQFKNSLVTDNSEENYIKYKTEAFDLAVKKIECYNKIYNFKFNKINIKNQKTRWGSCSRKGNLNFNYKIALFPGKIANYIIIHELCHLKEFNHSRKFWNLVAKLMPDYLEIKKELRIKGFSDL
ncbi:MAG: M48 family metallopeptidase, partial [Patescibacteria group bacterium]